MRVLRQRNHHDSESVSGQESEGLGGGDRACNVWCVVPLFHACSHAEGDQAVWTGDGRMTPLSRRDFLQASGALIVSFSLVGRAALAQGPVSGSPPASQLDSWIAIGADGKVTAYSGKEELG